MDKINNTKKSQQKLKLTNMTTHLIFNKNSIQIYSKISEMRDA